jgi:hypothetical protein
MIRLKAITPSAKAMRLTRFAKAAETGMEDAAKAAVKDFEALTRSWKHDVSYGYKKYGDGYQVGPTGGATDIFTDQDKGTKPHVIRPRRGRRLVFVTGGQKVFAKQVNHPGNKPRGWSTRIRKKYEAQLHRFIERRIREAM